MDLQIVESQEPAKVAFLELRGYAIEAVLQHSDPEVGQTYLLEITDILKDEDGQSRVRAKFRLHEPPTGEWRPVWELTENMLVFTRTEND